MPLFSNQPQYIRQASHITCHLTQALAYSYPALAFCWFARQARWERPASQQKLTVTSLLLPSSSDITDIPADGVFCLDTCCTFVLARLMFTPEYRTGTVLWNIGTCKNDKVCIPEDSHLSWFTALPFFLKWLFFKTQTLVKWTHRKEIPEGELYTYLRILSEQIVIIFP
jgi:hypothetical protein